MKTLTPEPARGIDLHIDYAGMQREKKEQWTRKLADKHARCIGTFNTGLACNCGEGTIRDHAAQYVPRVSLERVRFGPQPTAEEQFRAFSVTHRYWCEECGARYENVVIEGKRRYVPPDKRSDPE